MCVVVALGILCTSENTERFILLITLLEMIIMMTNLLADDCVSQVYDVTARKHSTTYHLTEGG